MRLRLFALPALVICALCVIARWRDNMPKGHWPFSLLTRFQRRPGVIPTSIAVRFVAARKKFSNYSDVHDAPWRWYEPVDVGKVAATGGHGTDLFEHHRELPAMIADWFVTTLLKTPGHAPAESIAAADTINRLETPGGAEQVTQQLIEARKADPQAQLFPEIIAAIVGADYMRAGDLKAIEVMKLVLLAYPDSADANDNLASAYLKDGQSDLARQHAEKTLAILDAHKGPASSWTDTEEYRGEIRRDAQKTLKKLSEKQG
jgi:hypothetical protein